MSDTYIGAYLKSSDMRKIIDRWAMELNNKLSARIRVIGRSKGIAKSRKRKLLRFFLVTKEEYDQLINPTSRSFYQLKHNVDWEPKLIIKKKDLSETLDINLKIYEKNLNDQLTELVHRI